MEVLIGLGGNLGDVGGTFSRARAALATLGELVSCSSLWTTVAQGPPQPDYLNAAVRLRTRWHPERVLAACQGIEASAGRTRAAERRWGPRTLDLDLLLAPGIVIESRRLTLPHPRLHLRRFALLPAAELAPDWLHPRLGLTIAELARALDEASQPCRRLREWMEP
jgi:2-amino-4-hydroxy-6-hydroxymethyldihydropteridine diphosphokinase